MARSNPTLILAFFAYWLTIKNPLIGKLFCPYNNMYTMLTEIAEKAMGEIAYNKLGKNTYLPAPGSSGSYPFSPRAKVSALIVFINNLCS
jgi:hypothetical protein